MRQPPHLYIRRRNRLVNPRLQGGLAVRIAGVVCGAGAVIAILLVRDVREALWHVSFSGHFNFPTPFRLADDILARWFLWLFALVYAGGSLVFLWSMRKIRWGISRLVETLEASEKGDLSSPTSVRGIGEISDLGAEIDEVRSYALSLIGEVRGEAEALRTSALSLEEFTGRWEALKAKIGRIVP